MDILQRGLTMRQILLMSLFFRFYEYEFLLNWKFQLVDTLNGMLSKDGKELNWKNIYSNSLLSSLFDENDEVIIDESHAASKQISSALYTNDYLEKWQLFNNVRKKTNSLYESKNNVFFQFIHFINFSFEDFFKDMNITNNILANKEDKINIMHILLNIYKILLTFPHHVKRSGGKDSIAAIKTKMAGNKLAGKKVDYLKGDFDNDRLTDYTSTDPIDVYIASIDSYYFLYKKYDNKDKHLFMLFEVYDYIESVSDNAKYPDNIKKLLKEFMNTLHMLCMKSYDIDINNLF